jgi:hypothetical protein
MFDRRPSYEKLGLVLVDEGYSTPHIPSAMRFSGSAPGHFCHSLAYNGRNAKLQEPSLGLLYLMLILICSALSLFACASRQHASSPPSSVTPAKPYTSSSRLHNQTKLHRCAIRFDALRCNACSNLSPEMSTLAAHPASPTPSLG